MCDGVDDCICVVCDVIKSGVDVIKIIVIGGVLSNIVVGVN